MIIEKRENYPFWFSRDSIFFWAQDVREGFSHEYLLWRTTFRNNKPTELINLNLSNDIKLPIVKVSKDKLNRVFILDSSGKLFCRGKIGTHIYYEWCGDQTFTPHHGLDPCITLESSEIRPTKTFRLDEFHQFPCDYQFNIDGSCERKIQGEEFNSKIEDFYFSQYDDLYVITENHLLKFYEKRETAREHVIIENNIHTIMEFDQNNIIKHHVNGHIFCNGDEELKILIKSERYNEEPIIIDYNIYDGKGKLMIEKEKMILFPPHVYRKPERTDGYETATNPKINPDNIFFATDSACRKNIFKLKVSAYGECLEKNKILFFEDDQFSLKIKKIINHDDLHCFIWDELNNRILSFYVNTLKHRPCLNDGMDIIYQPKEGENIEMFDGYNGRYVVVLSSGETVLLNLKAKIFPFSYKKFIFVNTVLHSTLQKKSAVRSLE